MTARHVVIRLLDLTSLWLNSSCLWVTVYGMITTPAQGVISLCTGLPYERQLPSTWILTGWVSILRWIRRPAIGLTIPPAEHSAGGMGGRWLGRLVDRSSGWSLIRWLLLRWFTHPVVDSAGGSLLRWLTPPVVHSSGCFHRTGEKSDKMINKIFSLVFHQYYLLTNTLSWMVYTYIYSCWGIDKLTDRNYYVINISYIF